MNADVPMSMTRGSPVGRKTEGNRVGAKRRPRAAERRHRRRRRHRVDHHQAGAGDHFAVIGAAPGHPGVGEAQRWRGRCFRARDRRLGGAIGRDHARIVAAIEQGRRRRLAHHGDGSPRQPELRVIDDIQQFRQAGILVAAQRRVHHMVRQDARIVLVVPGAAHRGLAECARFGHRHADAVFAGSFGHRPTVAFSQPAAASDHVSIAMAWERAVGTGIPSRYHV